MSFLAAILVQVIESFLSKFFALIGKDFDQWMKERADKKAAKEASAKFEVERKEAKTKAEAADAGQNLLNS